MAEKILGLKRSSAGVVALSGELGAGKTTFIQGFLRALGVKRRITSPTFLIFKSYTLNAKPYTLVYHIDCYRLKNEKEILELGFKEIISSPENIVAVEWPERIKKVLPKNTIFINFKFIGKNKREIIIENF